MTIAMWHVRLAGSMALAAGACATTPDRDPEVTSVPSDSAASATGNSDAPRADTHDPTTPASPAEPEAAALGIECGDETCTPPDECISFPAMNASGPTVGKTCAVACDPARQNADCPPGRHCVPIADGPGPICR